MNKPLTCNGCVLREMGEGFMSPSLAASRPYKVALVGEALGADEARLGAPFVGRAGFTLTRLIEWAGLDRSRFDIWNTVWCRPPYNKLDGEAYETPAIEHCRAQHWSSLLSRVNVVVPMGNVPLNTFTGRKGITQLRGYVLPGPNGTHLLPTVHPSFIQRGQSKYSAAFIHDLQKAVELSENGIPPIINDYVIDPPPSIAYDWARRYRDALQASRAGHGDPIRLAYDIETPGKGDDEADSDEDASYFIWRIGFSFGAHTALTVPWEPAYIPAIKLLLESEGEKVVWNASFDNPRIRAQGVEINGTIHDGMVAWHILHSDLPKGLGFVATFTCPYQPAWKHTSKQNPGLYNCQDADVEWQSFDHIERELKETGLWDVYQRDVVDLDPVLHHMTHEGMPIDAEVRYEKACKLNDLQTSLKNQIEQEVPLEARKVSPPNGYTRDPDNTDGMVRITRRGIRRRCSCCGAVNPNKPHFKRYSDRYLASKRAKDKGLVQNPCAGAAVVESEEEIERWARLEPFSVNGPHQLIKYQNVLGRPIPTRWDKKKGERRPTMDDKAIKGLMKKYPTDKLYPAVLEWRALDKVAGTYIGRPDERASSVV